MTTRVLLLVVPDSLLRWALVTYMSRWFHVLEADSLVKALAILKRRAVDAVVVSSELSSADAEAVVRQVISQDTCARIVRIVACAYEVPPLTTNAVSIEKPFELAQLAHLLGIKASVEERSSKVSRQPH